MTKHECLLAQHVKKDINNAWPQQRKKGRNGILKQVSMPHGADACDENSSIHSKVQTKNTYTSEPNSR